jgi:hypothetical protein
MDTVWTICVLKNGGHLSPLVSNITLLLIAEVTEFSHLMYGISQFQTEFKIHTQNLTPKL